MEHCRSATQGVWCSNVAKIIFHGLGHQFTHVRPIHMTRFRNVAEDFPVAAVHRESYVYFLPLDARISDMSGHKRRLLLRGSGLTGQFHFWCRCPAVCQTYFTKKIALNAERVASVAHERFSAFLRGKSPRFLTSCVRKGRRQLTKGLLLVSFQIRTGREQT
jgi:hypothetical protein